MRDVIERRMREFLNETDPRYDWVRSAVRTFGFLPLYLGWVAVLGIRPDGSFVRWDNEDDPENIHPLAEPFLRRLALHEGAKRYPELSPLIPLRPANATDCAMCKGAGSIAGLPQTICECGGYGWVIPGEDRGRPTG